MSRRVFSFSPVSWMGPQSLFMFAGVFNIIDALVLSCCSIFKRTAAYAVLYMCWILVGVVGQVIH